jgi:hypothetical protein
VAATIVSWNSDRSATFSPISETWIAAIRWVATTSASRSIAKRELSRAIKAERERLWRLENAEAIRQEAEYVEKHGLPVAKYRQF